MAAAALPLVGLAGAPPALAIASPTALNRVMAATDPNRDPNWDWTQPVRYDLVTQSATYRQVDLPYFSNSGPAAVLNVGPGRDIRRQDGWRLVLRDFGPGAVRAFFMLYNRNQGLLRVFYYHPANLEFSHAIGKLSFLEATAARSAALLTLTESADRAVSSYGPERSITAVGAMGAGWCYLDFPVTGYDPTLHLKSGPTFKIEITGITETDIVLNGDLDLTQRTANSPRQGGGFDASDVIGAYKHVAQRFKDVEDARKVFEQMARANTGAKWADYLLHDIGAIGNAKWLSALGPVAGIFQLVLGGGAAKQAAPLVFDGTLELKGKMTTQAPLYTMLVRVPGSIHADPADRTGNILPLYDEPVGVFNVAEVPYYDFYHQYYLETETIPRWDGHITGALTRALVVEANLHVFRDPVVKATYVIDGWLPPGYKDVRAINTSNHGKLYLATGAAVPSLATWRTQVNAAKLAVQATLTPLEAAPGAEPITVIKAYTGFRRLLTGPAPAFPAPRPPVRPSSLVATTARPSGIDVRWIDNADNETSFQLQEIIPAAPQDQVVTIATLPANTTSYHVSGGIPGNRRTFRIRARNVQGSSPYSNRAASRVGGESCPLPILCR